MAGYASVALPYLYDELLLMLGEKFDGDLCRLDIVGAVGGFDSRDVIRGIEKIEIETVGRHYTP
jgi:hypothetical protein